MWIIDWANCNEGLAAWAQALFSVFAILAAFWLSRRQFADAMRVEKERADASRRERVRVFQGLTLCITDDVNRLSTAFNSKDVATLFNFDRQAFSDYINAAVSIPLLDVPNSAAIVPLVHLPVHLRRVQNALTAAWDMLKDKSDRDQFFKNLEILNLDKRLKDLRTVINQLIIAVV